MMSNPYYTLQCHDVKWDGGCSKNGFSCVVSDKGIHQPPLFGAPKRLFAGRIPPLPYPRGERAGVRGIRVVLAASAFSYLHDVPLSDLMGVKIDPIFEHPQWDGAIQPVAGTAQSLTEVREAISSEKSARAEGSALFGFHLANRHLQNTTPQPTLLPIQRRCHSPSERSAPQRTLLRRSHAPSTGTQAACVPPRFACRFCQSPAQPASTAAREAPRGRGIRLLLGLGLSGFPNNRLLLYPIDDGFVKG
jgi:hypothetical protein